MAVASMQSQKRRERFSRPTILRRKPLRLGTHVSSAASVLSAFTAIWNPRRLEQYAMSLKKSRKRSGTALYAKEFNTKKSATHPNTMPCRSDSL
jgi:hypothetical protein